MNRRGPTGKLLRLVGVFVLATGAMVLLGGCMTMELAVDVRSDGSGVFSFDTVVPAQVAAFMEMAGGSLDEKYVRREFLAGLPGELAKRVDVSVKRSDDDVTIGIRVRFADLDELNSAMTDAVESTPLFTEFELRKQDEQWVFNAVSENLTASGATEIDGDDPVLGGESFFDEDLFGEDAFGGLFAEPRTSFTIRFPGRVLVSNADRVEGRSATWDLDGPGVESLSATAELGGGMNTVAIGALVGGVAVVLIAVVAVTALRRRSGSAGGDGAVGGDGVGWSVGAPVGPSAPGAGAWSTPPAPVPPGPPRMPTAPPAPVPPAPVPPEPPRMPTAPPAPPPPVAPPPTSTKPDWYPDPWGEAQWRWHDGTEWTSHTS